MRIQTNDDGGLPYCSWYVVLGFFLELALYMTKERQQLGHFRKSFAIPSPERAAKKRKKRKKKTT